MSSGNEIKINIGLCTLYTVNSQQTIDAINIILNISHSQFQLDYLPFHYLRQFIHLFNIRSCSICHCSASFVCEDWNASSNLWLLIIIVRPSSSFIVRYLHCVRFEYTSKNCSFQNISMERRRWRWHCLWLLSSFFVLFGRRKHHSMTAAGRKYVKKGTTELRMGEWMTKNLFDVY